MWLYTRQGRSLTLAGVLLLGGNAMNEVLRIGKAPSEMYITVQGYKVTLCFAEKANPEVAAFVKQALLGAYSIPPNRETHQLKTVQIKKVILY